MKFKIHTYLRRGVIFIFLAILFGACHHSNSVFAPVSYSPFSFYTYNGGGGTDNYSGALVISINPYGYNAAYEYYEVNVSGLGTYYIPTGGGQVVVPYVLPGSYNFTVHVGCINAYNSSCYDRYVNGYANIYTFQTTQVTYQPN